jgi:hypothetical protein
MGMLRGGSSPAVVDRDYRIRDGANVGIVKSPSAILLFNRGDLPIDAEVPDRSVWRIDWHADRSGALAQLSDGTLHGALLSEGYLLLSQDALESGSLSNGIKCGVFAERPMPQAVVRRRCNKIEAV